MGRSDYLRAWLAFGGFHGDASQSENDYRFVIDRLHLMRASSLILLWSVVAYECQIAHLEASETVPAYTEMHNVFHTIATCAPKVSYHPY